MQWRPFEECIFSHDDAEHQRILRAMGGHRVYRNNRYQVVVRDLPLGATMLSIRRNDRAACRDWRDFQRIKNELTAPEREGLEIYPAEARKVDAANQYYLWVLPAGVTLPWGFAERMLASKSVSNTKQRPFDDPLEAAEAAETDLNIEHRFAAYVAAMGIEPQTDEQREEFNDHFRD